MSGDVQPRKRKDKRKKKDEEEHTTPPAIQRQGSVAAAGPDEIIHIHKESTLGGNICSKIVFFGLLGALGLMVGLIVIEYHGTHDVDTQSAVDSPWSVMLEGWVEAGTGHDDHAADEQEHDTLHEDDEHGEHDKHEGEDSAGEQEQEHEHEEETEGGGELPFIQQTFEDLRAAYSQMTPEEGSDVEEPINNLDSKQTEDSKETESEPEPSLTEEEEEEEEEVAEESEADTQGDDPLGQWKSSSSPELLAEEVEEIQTRSETEEEESEDESATSNTRSGPQSHETEEEQQEAPPTEASVKESQQTKKQEKENQNFEDLDSQGEWEIREELDEAERDLDEG